MKNKETLQVLPLLLALVLAAGTAALATGSRITATNLPQTNSNGGELIDVQNTYWGGGAQTNANNGSVEMTGLPHVAGESTNANGGRVLMGPFPGVQGPPSQPESNNWLVF